ncbi:MAG: putative porin [Rikenellaceae bacterium]
MQTIRLKYIASLLLLATLAIGAFAPSRAQSFNASDLVPQHNFDDTEDEEGEDGEVSANEVDSTKVRVKRPLESYFFSDSIRSLPNFSWNINRQYNRVKIVKIDTTLADWRIDYPFQKEGVGDMSLGGLGQASQPISFYSRENYYDNAFSQVFDAYTFNVENAPFYSVKKPFTLFSYGESGSKNYRESNFGITHSQNINPSTSFTIDYKARSTKGLYQQQDTKNHNLAVTAAHTGKRYSAHAGYVNNTITTEESGGIVGLWAIRDSIFEMPIGVPTKLGEADAGNKYRNNTIFLQQSYGIPLQPLTDKHFTMANHTAFYVGHTFEYTTWSKVYTDTRASYTNDRAGIGSDGLYFSEEGYYYDNWFINAENSRDSIRERRISNRLFVQAQPWDRDAIVGTLDGGVGFDFNVYNQFGIGSYLSGEFSREKRTDWFAYGSATGKFRRYLEWGGELKVYPSGARAGDLYAGGDLKLTAFIRNKPIILSGKFSTELRSPSYWDENLVSNHFIFTAPLDKESDTRINVEFHVPDYDLELGVRQSMVSNLIYYDTDCNIQQSNDVVSLSEVYLRKRFKLGGLNLDHRLLAQWSSDQSIVPLPEFSGYISYYYEFDVVKNVLRAQLGVDARYTTEYYMPDYNPALSTFFNQRDQEIGGYPYIDAYVSAKWKRMRILVKYQHLNNGMFGNNEYFTVANYPQNPGMLKMMFSWGFYD